MPLPARRRSRKPAKDPVVEQLLQAKDTWKDEVSHLIWDLIAFKRGLSGKGDTEHELPPTKITQPFGGSYTKLLAEMASEYQTLAQQALEIIQRQNEISQERTNRRERKPKKPTAPEPKQEPRPEPVPKLENPLAPKFPGEEVELGKVAGPLSRTMYRIKSPFSNEVGRKTRVDMLLKLVNLKHDVEEMQDAAVSLGKEDSDRLAQSFQDYSTRLFELHRLYQQYAQELGKGDFVQNRNMLFNEQSRFLADYRRYEREFGLIGALIPPFAFANLFRRQFSDLSKMFKRATNDIDREDVIRKIDLLYQKVIKILGQYYRTNGNARWRTISELYDLEKDRVASDEEGNLLPDGTEASPLEEDELPEEDDSGSSPLMTEAHNVLTRMLKRKRMNLPFGDWSASTRSKLFDSLRDTRQLIKKFMKAIEQHQTFEQLAPFINQMRQSYDEIGKDVRFLVSSKLPKEKKVT